MKITKRIKKGILQSVIFGAVFFIILVAVGAVFLYPKIMDIESKKQELITTYEKYNTVFTAGLSYDDLKNELLTGEATDYTRVLLDNVSQEFYDSHLINSEESNYSIFADKLSRKISDEKSSDEYLQRDKSLNTFLPTYYADSSAGNKVFVDAGEDELSTEDNTLSDFYFINYIENLLYSFDLSYDGEIGVGDIINVDTETTQNASIQRDLLEESIYAIPLSFEIVGRKSDIVDFLHYFENVASIEITEEGFNVPNDNFITRSMEGSEESPDYNIYENQLADIVSISVDEYPNSSVKTTESLSYAMKTLQGKERYSMEVELQFYVAGVPGYKMQAYINKLLDEYTKFSTLLKNQTQKYVAQKYKYTNSDQLTAIQSLQSLEYLILELEEDFLELRKNNAQGEDIESIYNLASQYNKQLQKIYDAYETQLETLTK